MIDDFVLRIHEVFGPTVQGEGQWVGTQCDFIRLYGCPVGCPWCDTGYSDGGVEVIETILDSPNGLYWSFDKVTAMLSSPTTIISGGEPFTHQRLPELVSRLKAMGKRVHIETSGAFYQETEADWITCSPKEHINRRYPVSDGIWEQADELKIVISTGEELEFYARRIQVASQPIYLQPEWNNLQATLPLTLALIYKSQGRYKLSLQTHKFIGVQ